MPRRSRPIIDVISARTRLSFREDPTEFEPGQVQALLDLPIPLWPDHIRLGHWLWSGPIRNPELSTFAMNETIRGIIPRVRMRCEKQTPLIYDPSQQKTVNAQPLVYRLFQHKPPLAPIPPEHTVTNDKLGRSDTHDYRHPCIEATCINPMHMRFKTMGQAITARDRKAEREFELNPEAFRLKDEKPVEERHYNPADENAIGDLIDHLRTHSAFTFKDARKVCHAEDYQDREIELALARIKKER